MTLAAQINIYIIRNLYMFLVHLALQWDPGVCLQQGTFCRSKLNIFQVLNRWKASGQF